MVIITITARTKSKRLPLKVLRLINGKPMIEQMIERLKMAKLAHDIVLCTSTKPQDTILTDYAQKLNIKYFRGDAIDVLKRLYDASRSFSAEFIVSTTADNPLTDPIYIDKIISKYWDTNADYITCLDLPLGTFSYGVKSEAIKKVLELKREKNTEIWGHYFKNLSLFRTVEIEVEKELGHPEFRLTVDTPEDLRFMREIFKRLYKPGEVIELREVVRLLKNNPELWAINQQVQQRSTPDYVLQDVAKLKGRNT